MQYAALKKYSARLVSGLPVKTEFYYVSILLLCLRYSGLSRTSPYSTSFGYCPVQYL